jgi:hypothetical protein
MRIVRVSEDRKIALSSHIFQGFWMGFVLPPLLNGGEGRGGRRNVRRSRHGPRDYVASGGGRAIFPLFSFSISQKSHKHLQKTRPKQQNPSRRLSITTPSYPSRNQYPAKSHHRSPSLIASTPPKIPESTRHPSLPLRPRCKFPNDSKSLMNGYRQSATSPFTASASLSPLRLLLTEARLFSSPGFSSRLAALTIASRHNLATLPLFTEVSS